MQPFYTTIIPGNGRKPDTNTVLTIVTLLRNTPAILLYLILLSCNQGETGSTETAQDKEKFFYPANDFIRYQVQAADSLGATMLMYTTKQGITDTTPVGIEQFKSLAAVFTEIDIASPELRKFYRQSFFLDASTGSYIYSYVSENDNLPVQSLDILLDTVTTKVKRILINRNYRTGDSTITEQLDWKPDHRFFINRIYSNRDSALNDEQIIVEWTLHHRP